MNGRRAKKLRKLGRGATVAGAHPAAKRWWEWMSARGRRRFTALVAAGYLGSLGAGWRSTFVIPTPGAPPPTPKRKRPRSGSQKRQSRGVARYEYAF